LFYVYVFFGPKRKRTGKTYRDKIPPSNPATQTLGELTRPEPELPFAFDNATLEERAEEQNGG
jgi:hypothetical protein